MALQHYSGLFGTKDAKVKKLTADPAGGTTTFATTLDVPGIKSVTLGGDITTAELRGDNTRLDYRAVLGGVSATMEWAKADLDVLAVLIGGAVADTGTTPNQLATLGVTSSNAGPQYFQLQAQVVGSDFIGGDAILTLYKCIVTSFPDFGTAEEDFSTVSVDIACIPRLSDGKWFDVAFRETTAALT